MDDYGRTQREEKIENEARLAYRRTMSKYEAAGATTRPWENADVSVRQRFLRNAERQLKRAGKIHGSVAATNPQNVKGRGYNVG